MTLADLLEAVDSSWAVAARRDLATAVLAHAVRGVAYDSRKVVPGALFVAIPGTRAEGTGSILLPAQYTTPLHVWAFYWNTQKGGKKGKENVSNSVYLNMSSEK
jgi:UDP-N-acetylmuramyl pentapeptide synthase